LRLITDSLSPLPAPRFRLGVYVFESAEILDFAAPYSVFSVAGNLNPGLEVVVLGESGDPVAARSGFTVVPARSLENAGALDALLLPGGPGSRIEMHNDRLRRFISGLPSRTLLASVCSGSLILGRMGFLDGLTATSRKEPDPGSFSFSRTSLVDLLLEVAPRVRVSHARLVDCGRVITSGGAAAGLDIGLHLLRRAGHGDSFVSEVARVMDYTLGYEIYLGDVERCCS
jgi:transcriptional regulator GlxA family with amidase domain